MKSPDVVIVGAGLFGQIIARHLRSLGMDVSMVDDRRPFSGSAPAACLMKPGWASKMSTAEYDDALRLLGSHYHVHELRLRMKPLGKRIDCHWVRPREVLGADAGETGRVLRVEPGLVRWLDSNGAIHEAEPSRAIVVCTGAWAEELIPELAGKITAKGGWAFTWRGASLSQPTIEVWSPYRQLVVFNRDHDELWASDGSALIRRSFTDPVRQRAALERCAAAAGRQLNEANTISGWRPYAVTDKPALLVRLSVGLFAATGGAKNGTLGAAWCARQLEGMLT